MKVLYVHQFFNTPHDGGSIRSYYLAKGLLAKGFEVHIITSHDKKKPLRTEHEGLQITYLPIDYQNQYGFWKRIRAYLGFAWKACLASAQVRGVDFCYIMTTPLTTGFIALFNKFLLRRPYIFEIGDLWPWVPIQMGVVKNQFLANHLYWWEKVFYKQSKGSIGLSPPISAYIKSRSPHTLVETVYNISDCQFFMPQTASEGLKAKYGIKDEIIITYTGTFGLANDLLRMVDIMKNLQHLPIKFYFVGMGAEKEAFEKSVRHEDISNCIVLPFQRKEGIKEILCISDAMLISFANHPALFTGSPNKLFDALAAGLLVITNFDGWIAELLQKEKCGFSFVQDSSKDFEERIMPYIENRSLLEESQKNARRLAEEKYSLELQTEKQICFLEKLFC